MSTTIEPVPMSQRQVLQNLLQFYIYDFTEYLNIDIEEETGQFHKSSLDEYWNGEPQRKHAFFIKSEGRIAGFAMVEDIVGHSDGEIYMVEFFVLKKYRRNGVGKAAATKLFDRFSGRWIVQEIQNNLPAQAFWRKVISDYTDGQYAEKEIKEKGTVVQLFTSQTSSK